MKIKLTDKREMFNFCEPYIIAELGSNHNGDMELAGKLIRAAKDAGADCVKFQSWSKGTIFSQETYEDNFFLSDDYRNRSDYTLEQIVEKFSISEQQLLEMKQLADGIGIDCTSTPFSKKEVDFLIEKLQTPFIKVASMDLNNYPFLEYIAKKGVPLILSTGLSELYEIDKAIRTIERAGNSQIVLLHCVSIYPPKDEDVNLKNIQSLQTLYPYPVGFSDHTLGFSIPLAAVAMGACIIEKHFTLDKSLFGWDHEISALPGELRILCEESRRIWKSMGSNRILCEEDETRKTAFRRSIVTTRAIKAGETINEDDIDYKRPGTGIAPEYKNFVIGRLARRDLPFDRPIHLEDLL